MSQHTTNLFELAIRVLARSVSEVIEEKKGEAVANAILPGVIPVQHVRPTQEDLLAKLRQFGFYKTDCVRSIDVHMVVMGCAITPVCSGDVVFLLFDNWDNNPDGINRTETLVPFSLKTNNNAIRPFSNINDYFDPKYISSVSMAVFNKSFAYISDATIDQGD